MNNISKFFYLLLLGIVTAFKWILIGLFFCLVGFLLFGICIGVLQLWESHTHIPVMQRIAIISLAFIPASIFAFIISYDSMKHWIKNKLN